MVKGAWAGFKLGTLEQLGTDSNHSALLLRFKVIMNQIKFYFQESLINSPGANIPFIKQVTQWKHDLLDPICSYKLCNKYSHNWSTAHSNTRPMNEQRCDSYQLAWPILNKTVQIKIWMFRCSDLEWFSIRKIRTIATATVITDHSKMEPVDRNPRWQLFGQIWNGGAVQDQNHSISEKLMTIQNWKVFGIWAPTVLNPKHSRLWASDIQVRTVKILNANDLF